MKIFKIAAISDAPNGWILPNGTVVDIGVILHGVYVRENPEKFNIKNDIREISDTEAYQLAFGAGAVRWYAEPERLSLDCTKEALSEHINVIRSIYRRRVTKPGAYVVLTLRNLSNPTFRDSKEMYLDDLNYYASVLNIIQKVSSNSGKIEKTDKK